ncbi:MAG: PilZ domain-containing protein [Deltaproteobacteria bacterium]|nr:PilZ domain-containing protein [Deltaproteobacteria bacterium]
MEHSQRQQEREILISFPVGIQLTDTAFIETQIYDCTIHGAFVSCDKENLPPVGRMVLLRGSYRRIPYSIEAMVKWVGTSVEHNCSGFGIEFMHEPTAFKRMAQAPSMIPSAPAPMPHQ